MAKTKKYRSQDGLHYFQFRFVNAGQHIDIICTMHPSLDGRSSDPRKTHLFHSGKVCFIDGREPTTRARAEQLAAQWAEYLLSYIRTGEVQS